MDDNGKTKIEIPETTAVLVLAEVEHLRYHIARIKALDEGVDMPGLAMLLDEMVADVDLIADAFPLS
jgi:hypothetical protein